MGIVTVNKDTGNNFADNDRYDDLDFTSGIREYKPYTPRSDWRVIVATIAGMVFAFSFLALVYGIWKTIYCWDRHQVTCARLNAFEPLVFQGVLFVTIGLIVWYGVARIKAYINQQRAIANRTNLVLDRFGDQFPADLFTRMSNPEMLQYLTERYYIANNLQRTIAPYQIYKSVNSLSISNSNQLAASTQVVEDESIKPVDPVIWLDWINNQPHVILAGSTSAGKTITAKAILAARITAGEQIGIIDPHSDSWFTLPVIGGGENWSEVKDAFESVYQEYIKRQQERDQYLKNTGSALPSNHFKRLTILLDEAFVASLHLSNSKKGQLSPWELFAEVLGSGARKVAISVIMLTQTTNVEDLGLSGPLRQNFTRIALDVRTIKQMISSEEKDSERREKLYQSLIGMTYPATTVIDAQVHLLDRTDLDRVAAPNIQPDNIWRPVRLTGAISGQSAPLRTDGQYGRDLVGTLRALRLSGVTREQARDDFGLSFSNDDWAAAL